MQIADIHNGNLKIFELSLKCAIIQYIKNYCIIGGCITMKVKLTSEDEKKYMNYIKMELV